MAAPLRSLLLLLALSGCGGCSGGDDTGVGPEDLDGDGHAGDADCDESDPAVYVGATELCNERDDDCDGVVDPSTSADAPTWYPDADEDTWGDEAAAATACEQPAGYTAKAGDCDDDDALVNPDADELCNGEDDDCDGVIDPASAADAPSWHPDSDDDGYGSASTSARACSAPAGFVADGTDCDDRDGDVHPDAVELCNGQDDDCDEAIDEGGSGGDAWYADLDGDGWGDEATTSDACDPGEGWASRAGDCDDTDPARNPGAAEIPDDGLDQDCWGGDLVCADIELQDRLGIALASGDVGDGDATDDPSCVVDGTPDVRLHWTAPTDGEFVVRLDGPTGAALAAYTVDDDCPAEEGDCQRASPAYVLVKVGVGEEKVFVVDAGSAHSGAWSLSIDRYDESSCTDGEDGAESGPGEGLIDCADPECLDARACSTALADEDLGDAFGAAVATGTTVGAGDDWPASCGGKYADDYAYAWLAPAAGEWTFSLAGSDYDTVLSVYSPDGATELGCNDDGDDTTSSVTYTARAGERVIVVVDGKNRATGDYVLSIE